MISIEDQKKILNLKKRYSIYSPFADSILFSRILENLAEPFKKIKIDKVLGLESRGFILGAPIAYILKTGFVVARKGGKMYPKYSQDRVYSTQTVDYSGKEKTIEIENNDMAIRQGDSVLIVDDWFETGGQGQAAIKLVEAAGGKVVGISVMLDDMTSEVRKKFESYNLHSLVIKEKFANSF